MARYDVYRRGPGEGYLLDCQADVLSFLDTRFVVPLLPRADVPPPTARLHPVFTIENAEMVMATHLAAGVPASLLRHKVDSLTDRHIAIGNAIDMLLSGY